jgi:hypothetical protein
MEASILEKEMALAELGNNFTGFKGIWMGE